MYYIAIKCINFDRSTDLFYRLKQSKRIITKIVLNIVLHQVGLSWVISPDKQMKNYIKENNIFFPLPVGSNLVVVCNLTHAICSVAFNGVK